MINYDITDNSSYQVYFLLTKKKNYPSRVGLGRRGVVDLYPQA